jgi:hypothetical protein
MNATTKSILQTATLFTALAVISPAGSHDCLEAAGKGPGTSPGADRAKTLSGSELYQALHDPTVNKPDGLGDYVQNFQSDRAPRR